MHLLFKYRTDVSEGYMEGRWILVTVSWIYCTIILRTVNQEELMWLSKLFTWFLCPQEPRALLYCWLCSSVSLLSKKALLSSFGLGREPWEEWTRSKGVTGIRAPPGQVSVSMAVVWFSEGFFPTCLVKLSPFEPPVAFFSWPRWKGWILHWALFSSMSNIPSGYNNMYVMSLVTGDLGRQSCFKPPGLHVAHGKKY